MAQNETVNFLGLDCLSLKNENLKLLVPQSIGPRILSLSLNGGENLLAELQDAVLECPGSGKLHLYGGHRLWHAPEEPSRTYIPDNAPVEICQRIFIIQLNGRGVVIDGCFIIFQFLV